MKKILLATFVLAGWFVGAVSVSSCTPDYVLNDSGAQSGGFLNYNGNNYTYNDDFAYVGVKSEGGYAFSATKTSSPVTLATKIELNDLASGNFSESKKILISIDTETTIESIPEQGYITITNTKEQSVSGVVMVKATISFSGKFNVYKGVEKQSETDVEGKITF